MKTLNLKFRAKDKANFNDLKKGIKAIETRAASSKYKNLEEGDKLIFSCGSAKFSKTIKKIRHFKSLEAMFKVIPFKKISPDLDSKKLAIERYYTYPNYRKKIAEFGIVAIEFE